VFKEIKNYLPALIIAMIASHSLWASSDLKDRIHEMNWDGLDVVWLEEDGLPQYNLLFYFADGALSDSTSGLGQTSAMFNLLTAGTRRFSQRDISDNLEFFGVDFGARVTHEYSVFHVSGLVKDIIPTMKQICHLFKDATFPANELAKEKKRAEGSIRNMVNHHSALADLAFRELSMMGTPYNYPASGKLKDLKKITQKSLKAKLEYFNEKVKKKIYISGPKRALSVKNVINEECGFRGSEQNYVRQVDYKYTPNDKPQIILVTVPKANQAQVRIGNFLTKPEVKNTELLTLSSGLLGGGFTSLLMRAVRFHQGLTYSINAFASGQRDYGRAGISTFTKNETVTELLKTIKDVIERVENKQVSQEEFELARGYIVGSYPFGFEENMAFLSQLLSYDHEGRPYEDIYIFPNQVEKLSLDEVSKNTSEIFDWKRQTIVVLGDKSLLPKLKQLGNVQVMSYEKFL